LGELYPMLTSKQAAFCQHLTGGMLPSEAYRLAYPDTTASTIYSQSSKMLKNPNIAQELDRIRQPVIQQQAWNQQRLVAELWTISQAAALKQQYSAATRALELIGKACGLLIDRQEITGVVHHAHYPQLTMDQLEAIASRAAKLEADGHTLSLESGSNPPAAVPELT
jgi:hypothetical protein